MRLTMLILLSLCSFASANSNWVCDSSVQKIKGIYTFSLMDTESMTSVQKTFSVTSQENLYSLTIKFDDERLGGESKTGSTALYLYDGKDRLRIDKAYLYKSQSDNSRKSSVDAQLSGIDLLKVFDGEFVKGSVSFDSYEFTVIDAPIPSDLRKMFSISSEADADNFLQICEKKSFDLWWKTQVDATAQ